MNHRTLPSKKAWCFTWQFLRFSPEGWVDWLCAIFCCTSTHFGKRRPQTILHQETPATLAYAVHVPPAMTLEVASPGAKIAKHHFSGKKTHGEAFSKRFFGAIFFFADVSSICFPKKTAWRCASSSSGHRRRPTGSWASKMDGTPHVICLVVAGWTNPSEKYECQIGKFPPIFLKKVENIWHHQVVIVMVAQHWWFQSCSNWKMDGPTLRCYQGTPPKTKSSPLKIHGWKMELLFGMVLFEEICQFLECPNRQLSSFLPFSDHRVEWVTVFSQSLAKGALKRGLYGQSYTWRAVSLKETTRWFQLIPAKNSFFPLSPGRGNFKKG